MTSLDLIWHLPAIVLQMSSQALRLAMTAVAGLHAAVEQATRLARRSGAAAVQWVRATCICSYRPQSLCSHPTNDAYHLLGRQMSVGGCGQRTPASL